MRIKRLQKAHNPQGSLAQFQEPRGLGVIFKQPLMLTQGLFYFDIARQMFCVGYAQANGSLALGGVKILNAAFRHDLGCLNG